MKFLNKYSLGAAFLLAVGYSYIHGKNNPPPNEISFTAFRTAIENEDVKTIHEGKENAGKEEKIAVEMKNGEWSLVYLPDGIKTMGMLPNNTDIEIWGVGNSRPENSILSSIMMFGLKKHPGIIASILFIALSGEIGRSSLSKKLKDNPEERKQIAYHEAGHALLSILLPSKAPLEKVTIKPGTGYLGFAKFSSKKALLSASRMHMENNIAMSLGGRAAEEILGGNNKHCTEGASADIRIASSIARTMITKYGMSDDLGPVYYDGRDNKISESRRERIEFEVEKTIKIGQEIALQTLRKHEDALDKLANALLERETLNLDEVYEVTGLSKDYSYQPDIQTITDEITEQIAKNHPVASSFTPPCPSA